MKIFERVSIRKNKWFILTPLALFMLLYFVSSIVVGNFYKIPISAAFLLSSIYAIVISEGKLDEKIERFSNGAGDKNVLIMIWIFILAGAFAMSAKEMGAIDATVNLALRLLPGKLLFVGLFAVTCFISMSIGTSVGTIVALVPIATGIANETEIPLPFMTAIIVGGSFFGDNLSFISDTTIASTRTQGCSMKDKFKANILIAAPAALIVAILYIVMGQEATVPTIHDKINILKLLPYIVVIVLAIMGTSVIAVLSCGIIMNAIIGFATGDFTWSGWLGSIGNGIAGMGDLIIITMLAGGMLELIRAGGGLNYIIEKMTRRIRGKRGAEFSIGALVSVANICTANNTIAIITTGRIAKDITEKYGLDPRKSASILDTFSCLIQGIIPYGAQMLMASTLAGISSVAIIKYLYYPFALGAIAALAIIFRFPRKIS